MEGVLVLFNSDKAGQVARKALQEKDCCLMLNWPDQLFLDYPCRQKSFGERATYSRRSSQRKILRKPVVGARARDPSQRWFLGLFVESPLILLQVTDFKNVHVLV